MIYNPYTPQRPDRADEWVESAENEPEETDREWPDEPGDEQCKDIFQEVAQAPLRKPLGKCVTEIAHDGVHWRL